MSSLENTNAFKPMKVGPVELSNRIVIAPLTRARATEDHTPTDLMLTHYNDLTQTPGSLVIAEASFVHKNASGWGHVPGLFTDRQLKAWRKITDKVHENKCFMSVQLWNLGRAASLDELQKEGVKYKSSSPTYENAEIEEKAKKLGNPLTALTKEEIKDYVKIYADVADKCINVAGFDMIEIHSAHGYIFDQFFQSICNKRTDEYGGSIENRSRFFFEVIDAMIERVGGDKVACRFSPWATFQGMGGIGGDPSPYAQFGYIFSELEKRRKKHGLAYLSIVEPRTNSTISLEEYEGSNDFIYDIYKGVIARAGDYIKRNSPQDFSFIKNDVDKNDRTLIILGRWTTSNPDIIEKLKHNLPLIKYNRATFYTQSNWEYNTWPIHGKTQTFDKETEDKRFGVPLA